MATIDSIKHSSDEDRGNAPKVGVDAYELLWAVYEKHRDALFGKLYFQARLDRVTKLNLGLEIALAIGTSSAVATWAIFKSGSGAYVWAVIAAFATIAAIVKPFLDLPKRIKTYASFVSTYAQAYAALTDEVEDIRIQRGPTRQTVVSLRRQREVLNSLAAQQSELDDEALKVKCQRRVLSAHPVDAYWNFPEGAT